MRPKSTPPPHPHPEKAGWGVINFFRFQLIDWMCFVGADIICPPPPSCFSWEGGTGGNPFFGLQRTGFPLLFPNILSVYLSTMQ